MERHLRRLGDRAAEQSQRDQGCDRAPARDDVVANYAETEARLRGPWLEEKLELLRRFVGDDAEQYTEVLVTSPAEVLEEFLDTVEDGSREATRPYLRAHGMTDAELDALTARTGPPQDTTLVVVQPMRPDTFFTADQQRRLAELMARWRVARDAGAALDPQEQAELEALVRAEVRAAGERAAALLHQLPS